MATMATLTMPLSSERADLDETFVGELLGQVGDPALGSLHEVLIADPAADERQSFELADGLRELLGEVLDLGDRTRGEDGDDDDGDAGDGCGDTDDGDTTAEWRRRTMVLTIASRARAISTPMPIRVNISDELRNDGEYGEDDQHGRDHGEERRAVEPEPRRESRRRRRFDR